MLLESCTRMGCYRYTTTACSECHLPYCFWHLQSLIVAPGNQVMLCETCLNQSVLAQLSVSEIIQSDLTFPATADTFVPFDLSLHEEEGIAEYDTHSHR
jgi:hypothetical protein